MAIETVGDLIKELAQHPFDKAVRLRDNRDGEFCHIDVESTWQNNCVIIDADLSEE